MKQSGRSVTGDTCCKGDPAPYGKYRTPLAGPDTRGPLWLAPLPVALLIRYVTVTVVAVMTCFCYRTRSIYSTYNLTQDSEAAFICLASWQHHVHPPCCGDLLRWTNCLGLGRLCSFSWGSDSEIVFPRPCARGGLARDFSYAACSLIPSCSQGASSPARRATLCCSVPSIQHKSVCRLAGCQKRHHSTPFLASR